jgi:hypothetical protein
MGFSGRSTSSRITDARLNFDIFASHKPNQATLWLDLTESFEINWGRSGSPDARGSRMHEKPVAGGLLRRDRAAELRSR